MDRIVEAGRTLFVVVQTTEAIPIELESAAH
jgi:hypothetical protein